MLSLRSLFTAKAALLALGLLGAAPAHAQNSICPDVVAGDSSNRCANTRFVATSIGAGLPLTNTFVYVGNASNIATGVAISGDCTITNLGILTCTKLNGVAPGTLFPLNAAPAGTLTGATLNGTVTASSLTSVGTLTGGATGAGFTVNLSTSTITGALPAANFPALTGDITTPGGSLATTLATVNANVGSFGGANSIASFTVNGKGLITAAAANVPSIPFTELTGQATYAQLPTGSALAVLGRSANSSGVYADIQCTAAGGGVVKESSSTIVCATIIDANIAAGAAIAYSKFANAGANTVLSNWTAGSAALVANTWPACASDGGHALTYTNGTGVLCTVIPSGGTVTSVTCSGLAITVSGTCPPTFGFQNCSLAASVGSNLLTVALKDNTGADPSAASPCNLWFRNATATTGSWSQVTVTAALSISTNATGASLGSSNSTAFRFWVEAFNNAGTAVLALYNASTGSATATSCFPIDETQVQSSTAISGAATSAGVYYTPNGTTVTSKAIITIGYVEYNATGLGTAGTYATGPNFIQTFGPGVHKPCEPVQTYQATVTSGATCSTTSPTTTPTASNILKAISPTSAVNLIRIAASGDVQSASSTATFYYRIFRGSGGTGLGNGIYAHAVSSAANVQAAWSRMQWDKPNTTSSTTYVVQCGSSAGVMTLPADDSAIEVMEIMG